MKRNPELAHKVSLLPEIAEAKHIAIDKLTAAHLAVSVLAKSMDDASTSALKELEIEERAMELMDEAVFYFHKYMRTKLRKYESYLQNSIANGNELIKKHFEDLSVLKQQRGIE